MERSRTILRDVARAADKVITSATEYANHKNEYRVQRSHFQLEAEMQRISVTCQCIADVLGKSTHPILDVRLQDWLDTDEPKQCLDTLVQIEGLFQKDASSWVSWIFRGGRGAPIMEDKIKEAADNFSSRKACFGFLFMADIWNTESHVQHQQDYNVQRESDLVGPALSLAVHTEINATIPIRGAYNELEAPASVQMELNNIPDASILQGEDIIGHGNCEAMPDQQQKKEEQVKNLEEIAKWLDGLNCAAKQDDTLSLRQPGTCRWLFDTPQYGMWRDGQNSFLWLRGKPGAGKSVLASAVIDSLETSRREGELLAFFYCDFRRERSTSSAEVLRSILSQLLCAIHGSTTDLGRLLEDMVKVKERGGSVRNNARQLAEFVSRVAALPTEKPLVIIDALDECKDVRALLQALIVVGSRVRLFVTSRPLHVITADLLGLPLISMDDMEFELLADIQLHVTRELHARHRLRGLDDRFKAEIHSVLCEKAGGMFRWIQCSMDTLDRCMTQQQIRRALEALPEGLNETYDRILLAIDTKGQGELARRTFTWLVAALRPLQLSELMEGLSINIRTRTLDPGFGPMHKGALLEVCGSLVTYIEKTGIVVLSHFSVKEYLISKLILRKFPLYRINWERAHLELARSCISYLFTYLDSRPGFGNPVSRLVNHLHFLSQPLGDYVLDNAVDHFRHLGPQFAFVLHDIEALAGVVRHHSSAWDNLCRSARRVVDSATPSWPTSKHDLALYILIAYAPDPHLQTFLRRAGVKSKEGTNPLVYAAYFNKGHHARTLLSRGVGLNCRGWDVDGFFQVLPIEVALESHHYAMVTLLVQKGSALPPHIFTNSFFRPGQLRIPSSIARMLLQTDYFSEAASNPLNEAVSGPMDVLKCLLRNNGCAYEYDLNAILRRFTQIVSDDFTDSWLILRFALKHGHISLARYLLSLGASFPPDLFGILGRWDGWIRAPMIQFLVENGINVHGRIIGGDPVLHIALQSSGDEDCTLEVAKALVDHGCDPLEANSLGKTPLYIAVEHGLVSVVRYLLSLGIPPSPNLLHVASGSYDNLKQNKVSMLICLLENGANVHDCTAAGPVLHTALRSLWDEDYALETAKVLISYGCNPLETSSGESPLHIALEHGLVSVAHYLLSFGIPCASDLLHVALRSYDQQNIASMTKCLLENGASVHACTTARDPALHTALRSLWHHEAYALETAKVLVYHGSDPLEPDSSGETPIHIAVGHGLVSVSRYLLSLPIPCPCDLLHVALRSPDQRNLVPMIICLLEKGVDVHACTADRCSVLHTAFRSLWNEDDALEITKIFVGQGCHLLQVCLSGETPLHIAVKRGFVSVTRYLLSLHIPPPSDLLHVALRSCDHQNVTPMAVCLVDDGTNIHACTTDGHHVLYNALQSLWNEENALQITKLLIDHGCNPLEASSSGETPVHIAVERGLVSIARYLLSLHAFAPPNLLHAALGSYNLRNIPQMVNCILENGAILHTHFTDQDRVILHNVLVSSWDEDYALEATRVFVIHGYRPLDDGSSGEILLRIAVKRGLVSLARYLLSLDVSASPDLLHMALGSKEEQNIPSMIACLLENGVGIHADTAAGEPMLHSALRSLQNEDGALKIAKLLVNHGCNPLTITSGGETLLHIAVQRGFFTIIGYLRSLGSFPSTDLLYIALGLEEEQDKMRMIVCLLENGVYVRVRVANRDPILHATLGSFHDEENALQVMKLLIGHGCNPLEANGFGRTSLHISVMRGMVSVARYLLSFGVPPASGDLLHVALRAYNRQNPASMISCLLENGVNVHARAATGDPVLYAALQLLWDEEHYALETAKVLVYHGCNPLEASSSGKTPFHIAVERGYVVVTRYLLSLGIPPPPDLLHVAFNALGKNLKQRALSMIICLLENGADAHIAGGDCVLHIALRSLRHENNALTITKLLIDHGSNPFEIGASGITPLHIAVKRGFISIVRYFLSLGISPSSDLLPATLLTRNEHSQSRILHLLENQDNTRTHSPAKDLPYPHSILFEEHCTLKIIKLLVAQGCNPLQPDSQDAIPLCIAIQQGRITLARILLLLCTPSSSCDILWLVLTSQQFRPKLQTVDFLIDQGASVFEKAGNGDSLLHVAIASVAGDEVLQVVALLLRRGCDPVAPNSHGATPFHVAVERGRISVVKLLLWLDVPLPPDILFTAVQSRPSPSSRAADLRLEIIRILVASGCDIHTRNASGLTPLDAAYSEGHIGVVDYLLSAPAFVHASGE